MDVPSTAAGRIAEVSVKKGDRVSKGSPVVDRRWPGRGAAKTRPQSPRLRRRRRAAPPRHRHPLRGRRRSRSACPISATSRTSKSSSPREGGRHGRPRITARHARDGQGRRWTCRLRRPARSRSSMSPRARASMPGDVVATLQARSEPAAAARASEAASAPAAPAPVPTRDGPHDAWPLRSLRGAALPDIRGAHASPSVRRFARELGVDLARVTGSGLKGRISEDDVKAFVKKALAGPSRAESAGAALPRVPDVDFAAFGPVEVKPLGRIQKISGARLQAAWVNIPHVTQHDEADITELEKLRASLKDRARSPRHQADAARLHRARLREGDRAVPELQRLARRERAEPRVQEVPAPRLRRRHAERPRGAGDPRRRSQGRLRAGARPRRARRQGARRQAGGRRDAGRLLHDLEPRRHRRDGIHARSSTRPKSRSSACRARSSGRSGRTASSSRA